MIDDEETIERFIDAFEASLNEEVPLIPDRIQILRDPEEIKAAVERQDMYLDVFSCPRNPSIERFLKNSAINFTRQDNSVTHLVFSRNDGELLGYFSLAIRPLQIPADRVSKSMGRRLERAGRFDRDANIYNATAYLIAQLSKNYTYGANERISG